jgi:hypothetical protein
MITPTVTIAVDERNVVLHFEQFGMTLRSNLRETITLLTRELLAAVRAMEPRRTGQLISLTRSFVDESEDYVRGRVRVLGPPGTRHNIAAAALEYGAHRMVLVRPHAERYSGQSIAVTGYERRANVAARRFLRGPAEAMRARVMAALQEAIDKSVQSANRQ